MTTGGGCFATTVLLERAIFLMPPDLAGEANCQVQRGAGAAEAAQRLRHSALAPLQDAFLCNPYYPALRVGYSQLESQSLIITDYTEKYIAAGAKASLATCVSLFASLNSRNEAIHAQTAGEICCSTKLREVSAERNLHENEE